MSFAIHGSVPLQTVHHGVTLNVYIYTLLGGPCDHKGDDLRDRRGKPDTGQLQHWRQDQKHQQRADRLSIYEKVGKSILFRCVEVRCCNTDKRQKQQRCEKKWEIPDDPGVCLCRSAKQRTDFCSCKIDTDRADCRDRNGGQVGQLSNSLNGRSVIPSVLLADQRLTAVAYSLQQQIEDRGNIADTAVNRNCLLIPVQKQKAIYEEHRDDGRKGQSKGRDRDNQDILPKPA